MSVSATATAATYNGNNSTSTGYAVTFPYLDPAHVKVKKTLTATGVSTTLAGGGVDFTLVEVGVGSPYVRTTVAIPTSYRVSVYRETPITQPLTLPSAGPFEAQSVERAFDRIVYQVQERLTALGGTLHLSDSAATAAAIPNTANTLVGFSSLGATKNYTAAELRDLILGLGVTTLSGNTKTWADETARAAISPDFVGQIGVQRDDASIWYAYALGGSYWNRYLYFKSWATADDRNSTTPDGLNQIGIQASDNTLWVSNIDLDDPGTLWKPYNHGPTLFEDQDEVDDATPNYVNELAIRGTDNALLRATGTTPGAWVPVNTGLSTPLAVTARSPFDVPGLILACTPDSAVTKDGSDRCTQWNDLSGNGNHLTQATAANGPVVIAASGSIPRLMRFDGSKSMSFPSLSLSQAGTIIVVGEKTAATSNANLVWSNAAGSLYFGFSRSDTLPAEFVGFHSTWGVSHRKPHVAGNLAVLSLAWQYELETNIASAYPFLRVNGAVNGQHGTGHDFGAADLTPSVLGGAAALGGYRLDGDLYEAYVWDRRLSDQELCDVEAYLASLRTVSQYSRQVAIVCEGDSLTAGQGVSWNSDFPNAMLVSLGTNYAGANLGIGGTVIGDGSAVSDMCRRAAVSVDKWAAEGNVLVFWAGTNDIATGTSAATTLARLWDYIAARRAAGWKRIVVGTPSYRGSGTWAALSEYRTGILAGAHANGVIVADIGGDTNFDDTPNAAYYSDSVHFNTSGYAYAAGLFKTAVQQALAIP